MLHLRAVRERDWPMIILLASNEIQEADHGGIDHLWVENRRSFEVVRKQAVVESDGAIVGFLHGFNICYDLIRPAVGIGVIMVAPKGPGDTLRRLYCEGKGLPCLFAVHQDSPDGAAEPIGLAWANAIGCARSAIVFE